MKGFVLKVVDLLHKAVQVVADQLVQLAPAVLFPVTVSGLGYKPVGFLLQFSFEISYVGFFEFAKPVFIMLPVNQGRILVKAFAMRIKMRMGPVMKPDEYGGFLVHGISFCKSWIIKHLPGRR